MDASLSELIAAYESGDREIAASAFDRTEQEVRAHLAVEDQHLLPELARVDPSGANRLRGEHAALRGLLEELAVGVQLHQVRIGAIRELARRLRSHAEREDAVLYRWADRWFSDPLRRPLLAALFGHGRSPAPPEPP